MMDTFADTFKSFLLYTLFNQEIKHRLAPILSGASHRSNAAMNAGSGSRVETLPVSHSRRAFAIYKAKSVALEAYYAIEAAH